MQRVYEYLRIYGIMLRNSLIREMSFKLNFVLWLAVESLWFVGQLAFIEVIYSQVNALGDWTKWQMVLLVGTHQIVSQIFQAFFYPNLVNLPELVRTGKLDFVLLQPADGQFLVSARQFGLDSLVNALAGTAVVIYSLAKLHLAPAPGQVLLYVVTLCLGVSVHYAVMFTLATMSFWITKTQGLIYGYYNMISLARYPDAVFKGAIKFVFSWVLPVIVVTNVPARLLMNATSAPWPLALHLVLASALMVALSRVLWTVALRRYASASS